MTRRDLSHCCGRYGRQGACGILRAVQSVSTRLGIAPLTFIDHSGQNACATTSRETSFSLEKYTGPGSCCTMSAKGVCTSENLAECDTDFVKMGEAMKSPSARHAVPSEKESFRGRFLRLAAKGALILGGGGAMEQGLRFVRNIILTRILAPEDFGVMAMVLTINQFLISLTEVGIKEAVIQNPRAAEVEFLNAAWWLSVLRGLLLYGLAVLMTPLVVLYFRKPDLGPYLQVAFLGLLLQGVFSPKAYLAIKQMHYGRWVGIQNGGAGVGILITIALGVWIKGAWALVIGFCAEQVMRSVLSFIICFYRPGFKFERALFMAVLKYNFAMLGIPIMVFIFMRIDVFVLGRLLSSSDLGLYSMAGALAMTPFAFLDQIVHQVIMPMLAQVQTEYSKFNHIIISGSKIILIIGWPFVTFLACYGADVLTVVYGPQYASVAVVFGILGSIACLKTVNIPAVSAYYALGKPELQRRFVSIRTLLAVLTVAPAGYLWGMLGVTGAMLLSIIAAYVLQIIRIQGITGFNLGAYFGMYIGAFGISLSVLVAWLLTNELSFQSINQRLFIGLLGLVCSYCLAGYLYGWRRTLRRKICQQG